MIFCTGCGYQSAADQVVGEKRVAELAEMEINVDGNE